MLSVNIPSVLIIAAVACEPAPVAADGYEPGAATAEAWLDRAARRIADLETIRCDLVYVRIEGVGFIDSQETRKGKLIYLPGPPTHFAVQFDRLIVDQRVQKLSQWYIFDGKWIVDRNDTEKIFIKRQFVPSDAEPGKTNPLALEGGPFKVPFTAKKEQLLKRLTVELMPDDAKDPPNTVHLRFKPKPAQRMDITQIDVWYDRALLVPVRAETLDDGPNLEIVTLEAIQLDEPVDTEVFDVSAPPKGEGWTVEIKPYEQKRSR